MRVLIVRIWAAGAVQVAILAANFVLPQNIQCRQNLACASPMTRHVFIVHWIYILVSLAIFVCLCFCFAPELAGASHLGRFLSAAISVFWIPRILIPLFVYDSELRRKHRVGDERCGWL